MLLDAPLPATRLARVLAVGLPAALALLIGLVQTRWSDPPRFDGAGYAVLAESLRAGRGYRAIDHPDAPPHAHFPPGYPVALAALWTLTGGPSHPAAHGLSLACSTAAVALFAVWLLRRVEPVVAGLLAASVAANWAWSRQASAIQSEPLFALLGLSAVLVADRRARTLRGGLGLGVALAACVLTRHVAATLVAAVLIDGLARRRYAATAAASAVVALAVLPWAAWQAAVGRDTQIGLFRSESLPDLVFEQARFYLGRIADLLVGPFVEVGTVFRPEFTGPAMLWASLATGIVLAGWLACLRRPAWRLAGLIPVLTLGLLLAWPFTEAGRFLVPLAPWIVVGAWSGLLIPAGAGGGRGRAWIAFLLLAAGLPSTLHSIITRRVDAEAARQADFDAACAWVGNRPDPPGPMLVRQAGEAFWLAGRSRTALAPPESEAEVSDVIARHAVAFLIVDDDRYVGAEPGALGRFVRDHPDQAREVFRRGAVAVYRVRPVDPASG
jgi:hypothetical protein